MLVQFQGVLTPHVELLLLLGLLHLQGGHLLQACLGLSPHLSRLVLDLHELTHQRQRQDSELNRDKNRTEPDPQVRITYLLQTRVVRWTLPHPHLLDWFSGGLLRTQGLDLQLTRLLLGLGGDLVHGP